MFSPEIVKDNFDLLSSKGLMVNTVNGKARDPIKVENVQRTFLGIDLEQINTYENKPVKPLKYMERRKAWDQL